LVAWLPDKFGGGKVVSYNWRTRVIRSADIKSGATDIGHASEVDSWIRLDEDGFMLANRISRQSLSKDLSQLGVAEKRRCVSVLDCNSSRNISRTYDVGAPFQPLCAPSFEFWGYSTQSTGDAGEVYFRDAVDQLLTEDGLILIKPGESLFRGIQIANISKEGMEREKQERTGLPDQPQSERISARLLGLGVIVLACQAWGAYHAYRLFNHLRHGSKLFNALAD
jgi:hypothetical protein